MRALKPTIAALFAYSAFAVAVVAGLAAGNATELVLSRGIGVMVLAYALGVALAWMVGVAIDEFLTDYRAATDTEAPTGEPDNGEDVEIIDEPDGVPA